MARTRLHEARAKAAAEAAKRDERKPLKLPPQGVTANSIRQIVEGAIKQALESQGVALVLSGFVEGKGLEGAWGVRVKDLQFGDVYIVPQKAEELTEDEPAEKKADLKLVESGE